MATKCTKGLAQIMPFANQGPNETATPVIDHFALDFRADCRPVTRFARDAPDIARLPRKRSHIALIFPHLAHQIGIRYHFHFPELGKNGA